MDKPDVDISLVKKLVELVEKHGLGELTIEEGGLSVTVKGPIAPAPVQVVHAASHAGPWGLHPSKCANLKDIKTCERVKGL